MFMEDRMPPKLYIYLCDMGFPGSLAVKNLPAVKELLETQVLSLGWEDPLEEGVAIHNSILAWRILPIDSGAWWSTVHRVAKSRTRLSWLSTHSRHMCEMGRGRRG